MTDQGAVFRALHKKGNPFIMANAWDVGSAKMLAGLGAKVIATSSAAHGFTLGRPDMGNVTRDEALSHAQDMVAAVTIPVSGDFENGFGDDPDTCAETVRLASEVGLAGICIEDTNLPGITPYPFDLAVERIRAAASAARALPHDFFLVARADGVMMETYDRAEAKRRLQAFEAAGADGLYAPVYGDLDQITALCDALIAPVNILMTSRHAQWTMPDIAKTGAARVSLGSTLARAVHRTIYDASRAMFDDGSFSHFENTLNGDVVDELLTK